MTSIKRTLQIASCLTVMGMATPAYASNLFLLQLGLFSSQAAASSQFDQVMESHGNLLDGMRYISKQSRPISGGDITWRTLVGPFENRKLASRACAELKESGQDCFVVETAAINLDEVESGTELSAKSAKEDKVDAITENADTTEAAESTETAAAESTSDSTWDWFTRSNDDEEKSSAREATDDEAVELTEQRSASNSNININTHSIYNKEETVAEVDVQNDIADSISSLFSSSDDGSSKAESTEEKSADDIEVVDEDKPAENIEIAEADESKNAVSSNLNAESKIEETKAEPEVRSGEVEIAEAIPVPLTEPENVPVTQSAEVKIAEEEPPVAEEKLLETEEEVAISEPVAEEKPSFFARNFGETKEAPVESKPISAEPVEYDAPAAAPVRTVPERVPLTQYRRESGSSRMLQVSVFENDRLAFQCLNALQGSMPAATMLRSRIIKSTTGQAVLRLGPVNDPELENAICNAAVECGEEVQCRIIAERDLLKPRRSRDTTSERRAIPSRRLASPYAPMPRNLSPIPSKPTSAASMNGPVWVQLGTSSSESDARSKFETLQSLYPDLLKSYSPVINTPENQSMGGRVYRLRVGSFDDRQKAQSLCASLSSRGVGCLVLSK